MMNIEPLSNQSSSEVDPSFVHNTIILTFTVTIRKMLGLGESPMDKRSHWTIESNIVNLSKITKNLSQVLENLEKEEVIDLYDLSLIKKCKTNSAKCITFYEIILKKNTETTFRTLVKALKKTGNDTVVDLLWIGDLTLSKGQHRKEDVSNGSMIGTIIGVLILTFFTSIPISIFLYMVKVYYDHGESIKKLD